LHKVRNADFFSVGPIRIEVTVENPAENKMRAICSRDLFRSGDQ